MAKTATDPDTKRAAAFTLAPPKSKARRELRRAALYAAMSNAGDASAPALGQMLDAQKDPEQRKAIVWALSEIESDESVAILARVAKRDTNKEVRRAAVQALGNIGTPAANKALRDLLNGER